MHFEFAANKMICFQFRKSPMIIPSLGIHKYARQNKARVRVISRVSKLGFELARLSVKFTSVTRAFFDKRITTTRVKSSRYVIEKLDSGKLDSCSTSKILITSNIFLLKKAIAFLNWNSFISKIEFGDTRGYARKRWDYFVTPPTPSSSASSEENYDRSSCGL